MTSPLSKRPSLAIRLLWFAGLWIASVFTLGVFAYAIRLALRQ